MQIKRCPTEKCYTNFVSLFRLQKLFGFCWDDWFLNSHSLGMLYAYFDYGVSHSLGYLDSSIVMIYITFDGSFWEFLLGFLSYMLVYRLFRVFFTRASLCLFGRFKAKAVGWIFYQVPHMLSYMITLDDSVVKPLGWMFICTLTICLVLFN